MLCEICSNYSPTNDAREKTSDCFLTLLEKIKIHYNQLNKDLSDCKSSSEVLKLENINLNKIIAELKQNSVTEYMPMPYSLHKERKSDYNKNQRPNSSKLSYEIVNELNMTKEISNVDWSESFFHSQQKDSVTSRKNDEIERSEIENVKQFPVKVLSPSNKVSLSHCVKINQSEVHSPFLSPLNQSNLLPKRLKLSSSKKSKDKNNENEKPDCSEKWITVKESKSMANKSVTGSLGMSFIQPQRSSTSLLKAKQYVVSPVKKDNLKNSPYKNLSLKTHAKLRQTKLIFDIATCEERERSADIDETFCEDIIQPSPKSNISEESSKTIRKKNLSSFSRKKSENLFVFPPKKIKIELKSLVDKSSTDNNNLKQKFENYEKPIKSLLDVTISDSKFQENIYDTKDSCTTSDSSSVMILPSQPDDVIIIENTDTDYNKINAKELIDEMELKSEGMSTFCGAINDMNATAKRKETQLKTEVNEQHKKKNENIEEILKLTCEDCREYFKCVGRYSATRIRGCQHKDVNLTPEDFWDPIFRAFPADDPRNETLIDDRFIYHKENF